MTGDVFSGEDLLPLLIIMALAVGVCIFLMKIRQKE